MTRQACNGCDAVDYAGPLNAAGVCRECLEPLGPGADGVYPCRRCGVEDAAAESDYCAGCASEVRA